MVSPTGLPEPRFVPVRTAEGAVLRFAQASLADRLTAQLLDQGIILLASLVIFLWTLLMFGRNAGGHALASFVIANFVVRNGYFSALEIGLGGATVGKRATHLRVVSRGGGPLAAEQVLARNLTREFELYLPLALMVSPEALFPDLPGWAGVVASLWMLGGALLPVFHPERLRLGDLLGGTLVVALPRQALLEDLTTLPAAGVRDAAVPESFRFALPQLDQYGIEQLHLLEDILRKAELPGQHDLMLAVTRRIENKIGWTFETPAADSERFLREFYAQLRSRLEQKALFGQRQERKREGRLARAPTPTETERPNEPEPDGGGAPEAGLDPPVPPPTPGADPGDEPG